MDGLVIALMTRSVSWSSAHSSVTAPPVVLSDDLTGAVAAAAELHRVHSGVTVKQWDQIGSDCEGPTVIDTVSRLSTPQIAAARIVQVLSFVAPTAPLSKRIDSALRGNVCAELSSLRASVGERGIVVAPAAPAIGFTTLDGRQRGPATAENRVKDKVPGPTVELGIDKIRSASLERRLADHLGAGVCVICDSVTNTDLGLIRRVVDGMDPRPVLVGSYGFLAEPAQSTPPMAVVPAVALAAAGGSTLILSGSSHPSTLAQLEAAREGRSIDLRAMPLRAEAVDASKALLVAGGALAVSSARPGVDAAAELDPSMTCGLVDIGLRLARSPSLTSVVLIGGELASQFIRESGVRRVVVLSEPWPTVPVVRLEGGVVDGLVAIIKSGARGSVDWLQQALFALRGDR